MPEPTATPTPSNIERVKKMIAEAKRKREEYEALRKTQGGQTSDASEVIEQLSNQ